ncbi:MAG: hypothetical protein ACRD3F_09950 [Acidobacteriaceae bacterium]
MRTGGDFVNRDPEDRRVQHRSLDECKEKMLDKTIADSFPASDPPSSIPNPCEDSFANALAQTQLQKVA